MAGSGADTVRKVAAVAAAEYINTITFYDIRIWTPLFNVGAREVWRWNGFIKGEFMHSWNRLLCTATRKTSQQHPIISLGSEGRECSVDWKGDNISCWNKRENQLFYIEQKETHKDSDQKTTGEEQHHPPPPTVEMGMLGDEVH